MPSNTTPQVLLAQNKKRRRIKKLGHQKINNLLKGTDGRGYVDLADINNRLGTPRAFESMPYWTGRNTLEGVYAQATITSPFISYTQCEISHHCAGIPTIALTDTNTDPTLVDYPIPSNDDALSALKYILGIVAKNMVEAKSKVKIEKPENSKNIEK